MSRSGEEAEGASRSDGLEERNRTGRDERRGHGDWETMREQSVEKKKVTGAVLGLKGGDVTSD